MSIDISQLHPFGHRTGAPFCCQVDVGQQIGAVPLDGGGVEELLNQNQAAGRDPESAPLGLKRL
ncbi:hypothetical protein [Mycobacterium sp. 852002-51057_SCH5723018]|uniref:hypothetical protein n=1 Tax=Mycobacterium sp. 852002-51057_SCH5723018 TaxID=1834094 RepID=UPI0007FB97E2|nr:hypothetical protein [Mycobacterium sp. 852002-51057_SCH5723018]OBG26533.1 hypothetical protein A5764_05675 [Mycobacterium sp. 852002-51057_SCH5723018]